MRLKKFSSSLVKSSNKLSSLCISFLQMNKRGDASASANFDAKTVHGALGRSRTDNLLIRSNTPNDYPLIRECFHKGYFTSVRSPNVRNSQTIG